jgi:alpha-L-rhamnosidase
MRMNSSFRKSIIKCSILFFTLLITHRGFAQFPDSSLLQNQWKACWITVPGESATGYGVYLFRKIIDLDQKPDSFVVNVSADNRYKLFVNEKQVSLGPARSDLDHWNFTTLDIAPFLHSGKNIIAAEVWNEGEWRPEGQISLRTGFILQGNENNGQAIITDRNWKCIRDSAYSPIRFSVPTYYVAGPGEQIDMNHYLGGWEKLDFSDGAWKNAQVIMPGIPKDLVGGYGTVSGWLLIPSIIPSMELTIQRLSKLNKAEGVKIPAGFPSAKSPITIPAHSVATIILDQSFLTNAYPEIIFSGGREGTISLSYAEAFFTKYPSKGNRNETEGKIFMGRRDSIISNGSRGQVFTPLTFRTYRYVQIKITTLEDPLVIEDVFGAFTGYPFKLNASLESDSPEFNKILNIGWRTARLCAMETYMDCPYYEQLQYIGDSRIQALISLYNSGDERLLRNAMNEMDNSRRPEGVMLSRHPSYTPQYIPTFSFWYIGMLHDYMMYGRDSNYIKNKLYGERQVLQYFRKYQQEDGSLKGVPFWMFTDWVEVKGWNSGVGPIGKDGNSSLIDLQLLWAYQLAADLESKYGMPAYVTLYNQYADQLKKTIRNKYWNAGRNLLADRPEKDFYSQHANTLAILTGMFDDQQANTIGKQMLTDTSLAPASIYFKFYLHQALVKAGLGNDYLNWLGKWRENINMGLTTWAEISDINNARSDCHAWGASPNIEFFRTILGIDSDAPGFTRIKIEPRLGSLINIRGEIPHPQGKISASYKLENGKWKIRIELPVHTSGNLIWQKKTFSLVAGVNNFVF